MKTYFRKYEGFSKKEIEKIIKEEEEEEKLSIELLNNKNQEETAKERMLKRELLVLSIKNLSFLNPNIQFSCKNDIDSIV